MLHDFVNLLFDYSIYIIPAFLLALLISSILVEVLPEIVFEKLSGSNSLLVVFMSSFIGALIPICTCGMIPLATKLQKKGASWLIVVSFLTAGNASSLTALILTLVLGLKITLARFLFAVIFGIIVAYIFVLIYKPVGNSYRKPLEHEPNNQTSLVKKIIHEFFDSLLSFGPWVLVAVFIAAAIALYLKPEDIMNFASSKNITSSFLLAISGFPFYFCAGSDIPISKVLLEKGASLGSVLTFMTASSGVNLTSFFIYQKWLGVKTSVIYLTISFLVCGILGLAVNMILK